jgi:peptidoglycan-associated lipoprotein
MSTCTTPARGPASLGTAALAAVTALVLVGCGSSYRIDDHPLGPPVLASAYQKAQNDKARAARERRGRTPPADFGAHMSPAAQFGRTVYFDYDSFAVHDEYADMLQAHARTLMTEGSRHLLIEGHTDERGGSEYNLALGQKRAEAVLKSLESLGVPADRLEAVSYGKERPAVPGSDEAAWARNRRAELKDQ